MAFSSAPTNGTPELTQDIVNHAISVNSQLNNLQSDWDTSDRRWTNTQQERLDSLQSELDQLLGQHPDLNPILSQKTGFSDILPTRAGTVKFAREIGTGLAAGYLGSAAMGSAGISGTSGVAAGTGAGTAAGAGTGTAAGATAGAGTTAAGTTAAGTTGGVGGVGTATGGLTTGNAIGGTALANNLAGSGSGSDQAALEQSFNTGAGAGAGDAGTIDYGATPDGDYSDGFDLANYYNPSLAGTSDSGGGFLDSAGQWVSDNSSGLGALASGATSLYAANQQQNTIDAAAAEERRQFDIGQANQQPWLRAGKRALTAQQQLMGLTGSPKKQMRALRQAPGYRFRRQEGQRATEAGLSARGGMGSGKAGTALQQQGQNFATGEYGNRLNQLASLSGTGQTQANQMAGQGQQFGSSMGDAAIAGGNARMSGILGAGNALSNYLSPQQNQQQTPQRQQTGWTWNS